MSVPERLAFNCGTTAAPPPVHTREKAARAEVTPAADAPERDTLAFRALLGFLVLLLARPQDTFPFLGPLHLADLLGVGAVLAVIAGRMGRGEGFTRMTPELQAVFAFAGVMLLSVPLSIWPGGSLGLFRDVFIKILIVVFVIVNTVTTRKRVEAFAAVLVACTAYVGARAIFDYARGVNLIEDGRVAGPVGGLFGNPNDMALTMISMLPFAGALAISGSRKTLRRLGVVAVPAMMGAIVFSKSRGGMVGVAAMVLVLLYHMRRVRPGLVAFTLVAGLFALPMLPSSFVQRMSSIVNAEEDATGSRESRKTLLREGFDAFLSHPVTGIGFGQFPNYNPGRRDEAWRQTHNAVLQVAAELGAVGLAVFLYMFGTAMSSASLALRSARLLRKGRADTADATWLHVYGGALIAALTGWFVAALFASVAYYWTLYLLLGAAAGVRAVSSQVSASRTAGRRQAAGRAA
jgi:O-antigen ligase